MSLRFAPAVFIIASLAACGGGGDDGGTSPAPTTSTPSASGGGAPTLAIESFAVVSGSDSAPDDGSTEINSGINGGAFTVDWIVDLVEPAYNTDSYSAELFLSENDTLEASNDFNFATTSCGTVAGMPCAKEGTFRCEISISSIVKCTAGGKTVVVKDISPVLNTIPKTTNVLFKACNLAGTATVCDVASQQITFH